MTTVIVRRSERPDPPELPSGEITLEPPPEIPEVVTDSFRQTLMYLPMLAMVVGMVSVIAGPTASTVQYVGGGAMALGMGGMMLGQIGRGKGERNTKLNGLRRDYLRYLGQVRGRVRRAAVAQRDALEWVSPDPRALTALLVDPDLRRVWERRPAGADFAKIRIGTGTHRLAVRLVPPDTKPVDDLDPLCAGALRRFVRAYGSVPGLPVGVSLRSFARVALAGEPDAVYGMLRAMIAQLAVFHSPDDVRICVCASRDRMRWWQWIKWLPHNMHPAEADAAGPVRLMAPSLPMIEAMLGADLSGRAPFSSGRSAALPLDVVIVDGGQAQADSRLGSDGDRRCGHHRGDVVGGRGAGRGHRADPAPARHRRRHRDADQGQDRRRGAVADRRPRHHVARRGRRPGPADGPDAARRAARPTTRWPRTGR